MPSDAIVEPPVSLWAALRKIGPGIILAGSIVGSGELIVTTRLGAIHGFVFLWLILFSCLIKVFVQIELGRYAISSGKPTLGALNDLPGPRLGAHWLVWWWFFMLLATVMQLGAMTALVGQSLNIAFPSVATGVKESFGSLGLVDAQKLIEGHPEYPWAVLICLFVIGLLWGGGYRRVEILTTYLVATVTILTVVCVLCLPATDYPIRLDAVLEGFQFAIPAAGMITAFSMFGITGVGASELYSYPYWCLEKGYARYAGPMDDSEAWLRRARGWIRVMYLDAWVSMLVFTVATVAFYCMGAAVLHEQGLAPEGKDLILTLSQMYVGPFGQWTQIVFLIGAGAVLFKTLYVSCASHSRLTADFFSLAGFVQFANASERARWIRGLCIFFPVLALVLLFVFGEPFFMVTFGGIAQGLTLPVISGATLYLRYRRTDRRIAPSWISDLFLWIAVLSISMVAIILVGSNLPKLWK